MKKRIFCILTSFLCVAGLSAQHTQLHWLPITTFMADSNSVQAIALENGVYSENIQLPSFIIDLPNNNLVQIGNYVYTNLSSEEEKIAKTNLDKIPQALHFEQFQQINRKVAINKLEVFPFVQENGIVKKIQSFDIQEISGKKIATKIVKAKTNY